MKWEGKHYVLSTGKIIQAYTGSIGINYEKVMTEGYDGFLYSPEMNNKYALTKKELIEITEYMINKWKEFKHDLQKE